MPDTPIPYSAYPDDLAYIVEPAVKEAFAYLVQESCLLSDYEVRPARHGKIRNLTYFRSDRKPFAFTVAQKWLLFYLREPAKTHPNLSLEELQSIFPTAKKPQSNNDQMTFRIELIADVRLTMGFVFGFQTPEGSVFPDELHADATFSEGMARTVQVNSYERSDAARKACIAHHGFRCAVCAMSFSEVYGSLGETFIHVHHLVELSSIRQEYVVDPIRDLRPVCPNCHAMLHRRIPALSLDELKRCLPPALQRDDLDMPQFHMDLHLIAKAI